MKKLSFLATSVVFMLFIMIMSCNSQSAQTEKNNTKSSLQENSTTVTVYYFHGDRRCTTCKAVGKVSKETIAENFADNSNVIFKDVNIEEPENNEIKDKLEMSGSGLFIYDGKTKVDLTAIAFQKAVSNPEELSEKIVSSVKDML
ncbi:MAG: nitrophenyl compound nitroreductase subunit ArsF family protein [Bacteroidales bacterium]|jgi:hypothetical protein|nr:nitrophenyl compound nitroreductase subunit ArsF family protein [Bacteroidales bacterium]